MAGVQSLKEEFLTCTICTDVYTDPCTLNCGHSFCRKCLTDFLMTRQDSIKSQSIPCAHCRQDTRVPYPNRPAKEWARQIKPSLILQGLMDRFQSGHKDVEGEDKCFLCEEVGERTPASFWCSDCEITLCSRCAKMHLKAPSSKKHDVFDLSGDVKIKRRKVICEEHEEEEMKFICTDCKKTACQTCCIIEHRKCKHVVTIESMVQEIKSNLKQRRRTLQQKIEENIAGKMEEERMIEQAKTDAKTHKSDLKSAVDDVMALLEKKQKELLCDIDDTLAKQISQHEANIKSRQVTTQMYQQHCEFIDQALQSEFEMNMYDMYQICQTEVVEEPDSIDTSNLPVIGDVKFIQNVEPVRKAITAMGKINVTFLSRPQRKKKHIPTVLSPSQCDTIFIQHPQDAKSAGPIDASVLTVGGIYTVIVADCNNKCLKSVYEKAKRKEMSKLQLSGNPLRTVKLAGNRVATTTENSHIVVADVRPELVLISDQRTKKEYHGLSSLFDSNLVVGSFTPPVIDIIDLRGNVLKSFTSKNIDLSLLQNPHYISTTHDGNILISDCYSKSVYCLTSDGEVVFTYTPTGERALEYPRGIAVTDTGDILLADWGSTKIIQLTPDGTFVKDILTSTDGIEVPWGLCVDESKKLHVCQRAVDSKCIKVFQIET